MAQRKSPGTVAQGVWKRGPGALYFHSMESAAGEWKPTTLWELLQLDKGGVVAVVGAGGKSAALRRAGAKGRERGAALLLSVTTRLATAQERIADRTVRLSGDAAAGADLPAVYPPPAPGEVVLFAGGRVAKTGKTEGVSPEQVCILAESYPTTPLMVEADGAAGADLKVPGPGEPVIPGCARAVLAVTALRAIDAGCKDAKIHRREALARLAPGADLIDATLVGRLLAHSQGCFKATPPGALRIWLVNQADTPAATRRAREFAEEAVSPRNCPSPPDFVVVGSLRSGTLAGMSVFGYSPLSGE